MKNVICLPGIACVYCHGRGIIIAYMENSSSADYFFRCDCPFGHKKDLAFPFWNDTLKKKYKLRWDYLDEFEQGAAHRKTGKRPRDKIHFGR